MKNISIPFKWRDDFIAQKTLISHVEMDFPFKKNSIYGLLLCKLITDSVRRFYRFSQKIWVHNSFEWNHNIEDGCKNCSTAYYYHVTTSFSVNPHSIVYLNVTELLARSRRHIWSLCDSNVIRTYNHLVRKRTFNHWAKLASFSYDGFWKTKRILVSQSS